jgi:putative PEP-CTERM system TPR-repeat lipoprotein
MMLFRRHTLLVAVLLSAACSVDPDQAKRQYLASGDRHLADKQYAQAIIQYRNALQQDPRFGEARLKLAQTYEQQGDLLNAMREYVRAADALPNDAATQVKAASYLLLSSQFEDARARAQSALALDPKHVQAHLVLGHALAGLKDLDGALKQLEDALRLDPTSVAAQTAVGGVQLAKGRREAAEAAFRRAVALDPQSPSVHLALANYLWSVERFSEAEQAMRQALALSPESILAHRALATLLISTARAAEAEPHLKAIADQDETPAGSLKLAIADYYIVMDRPDDALKVLEPLSKKTEAAGAAGPRIAAIRYVSGRKDEAHRIVDATLAAQPQNVLALLVRARFKYAEGNLDEALAAASAAAKADPQSVQARYLMGNVLRAKRQIPEAIAAFNEVLKINPRAAAAQLQLASLNLQHGQANTALQLATDAARQLGDNPQAQLTLVQALVANKQLEQAQRTVTNLQKAHPGVAAVQAAVGAVAMARRDAAGARRAFTRAVEIDPQNVDAVAGLVRLDLAEKKVDAARARIEGQLARLPSEPAVLTLAARFYTTTGDAARAEALLKKVVDLDSSNMQAFGMLGQLYASQKRLPEARASFEAILKDRPDAVGVTTLIGTLYDYEGNRSEAQKRYEQALQLDPGAAIAANNLAYIYAEQEANLDSALQLAQVARQKLPKNPDVADTLAWVYVKKNLASIAMPLLEEAMASRPDNPLFRYHLGVAQMQQGQKTRGRQTLEQALAMKLEGQEAIEARKLVSP